MPGTMGFTGTQYGMTEKQREQLIRIIMIMNPDRARHGDCVGSDETFHGLLRMHRPETFIIAHPCDIVVKRAFCEADRIEMPLPPLSRNRDIAEYSTYLVATPNQTYEIIRSGTWTTVRYALAAGVPVLVIEPEDGKLTPRGEDSEKVFAAVLG